VKVIVPVTRFNVIGAVPESMMLSQIIAETPVLFCSVLLFNILCPAIPLPEAGEAHFKSPLSEVSTVNT
jgi:hypothetical protein